MSEVNCPYCYREVKINHDDGYGYEEGEIYAQECRHCGKTFTYTTAIMFYHEAEQAPCQNGEEHCFEPIQRIPDELGEGISRCKWCGEEKIDHEVHRAAVERYLRMLEANQCEQ